MQISIKEMDLDEPISLRQSGLSEEDIVESSLQGSYYVPDVFFRVWIASVAAPSGGKLE